MRFTILIIIFLLAGSSIQAQTDSTMKTYRGVLKESNYSGMTKLFNSPRWRYEEAFLIERTGHFTIGNSVLVTGYIKTTSKEYDYPVLHVQSIEADSAKTTFRGVLEKSKYSGMTKLKLLFYLPFLDYSYLIERTGNFEIGDSVVVIGDEKATTREYDYPVLHVQSIDGFTLSDGSDTTMRTIAGTLRESHNSSLTIFSSANFGQSYYIERTGNFEIDDNVIITGYVKETSRDLRYPILHVKSIDAFECCVNDTRGDINLDGSINIADIINFAAYLNNQGWVSMMCSDKLDINGDSFVNDDDYDYLYDYIMRCGPEPVDCNTR